MVETCPLLEIESYLLVSLLYIWCRLCRILSCDLVNQASSLGNVIWAGLLESDSKDVFMLHCRVATINRLVLLAYSSWSNCFSLIQASKISIFSLFLFDSKPFIFGL